MAATAARIASGNLGKRADPRPNGNRPQLTDAQAANYISQKYLAGSEGWNPK